MPYTPEKPPLPRSIDELKRTIPGWGVDLQPEDRPAVPRENYVGKDPGAHWDFPERQPELWPRERSNEHMMLTPVFGTSCRPKGISGMIRRFAYKYSEGTNIHWLMLIGADRVDVLESRISALLSGRPDNPITESGIKSELKYGIKSRVGRQRADVNHQPIDAVVQLAPWVGLGVLAFMATRSIAGIRENRRGSHVLMDRHR